MRALRFGVAFALGLASLPGAAFASVDIRVDLSSQSMRVEAGNGESYVWPVSTARRGFRTPRGTYGVQRLDPMHYSRKYQNAPMPHSIFFHGGYAIHGSYETASLGRAASHGCIRLSPSNAAVLYRMVAAEGAHITITGSAPDRSAGGSRRHRTGPMGLDNPDVLIEQPTVPGLFDSGSDGWSLRSSQEMLEVE